MTTGRSGYEKRSSSFAGTMNHAVWVRLKAGTTRIFLRYLISYPRTLRPEISLQKPRCISDRSCPNLCIEGH